MARGLFGATPEELEAGLLEYRRPDPDYVGQVSQRVGLLGGLLNPANWVSALSKPFNPGRISYNDLFDLVTNFAPLGIMKGVNAALSPAEKKMLQKAMELEQQGMGREAIRQATNPPGGSGGWFRAPWDKKWRMEIDDSAATYHPGRVKARVEEFRNERLSEAYDASVMRHWMENENIGIVDAKKKYRETFGKDPRPAAGLLAKDTPATTLLDQYNRLEKAGQDKTYASIAEEYLPHPQAYEAYPQLGYTRFAMSNNEPFTKGSYSNTANQGVELSPVIGYNLNEGRSVGLHELQHGVQDIEGFARGGSPGLFEIQPSQIAATRKLAEIYERGDDLMEYMRGKGIKGIPIGEAWEGSGAQKALAEYAEWQKIAPSDAEEAMLTVLGKLKYPKQLPGTEETARLAMDARKQYDDLLMQSILSPEENYRRLAGEAESRLVEARRDLTPAQRSLLDPIEQMDTMLRQEGILGGLDDLIVRYGDGPAMAKEQGLLPEIPDELAPWAPAARREQWRTARANAALPVEQGGLGLGPANTAAERAKAGGFNKPATHVTNADIEAFDLGRASPTGKWGRAIYAADEAKKLPILERAVEARAKSSAGMNDMPLLVRMESPYDALENGLPLGQASAENMARLGYDGVQDVGSMAIFNPANIRSRFAAFDPKRRHEADLLASLAPWLLAGTGALGAGLLSGYGYD